MRGSISSNGTPPASPAGLRAMMAIWVALAASGCNPQPTGTDEDAAQKLDVHRLMGTGGNGGAPSGGGAGGDNEGGAAGGLGGEGGAGGDPNGGMTGGGGEGGSAGSGGKDAGPDARQPKDVPMRLDTDQNGIDSGSVACDDIKGPGRLAIYYYSSAEASSQSILMSLDLVNFTAFSARLSEITVRYWFTDEGPDAPNVVDQFYVPVPTTMKFHKVDPPRQGADTYIELSYNPSRDAGASFVETRNFNFAFHKSNYAGNFDQTNDYSYDPKLTKVFGLNPKITAYINGQLAWGCEPPAK